MMQIYPDMEALARASAHLFVAQAIQAVRERGRFSVALSGGTTPKRTYELLAEAPSRAEVPWSKVHLFWGDERCVPPTDPKSNYRMAHEALLKHVPIPEPQIHRMRGELSPAEGAAEYEKEMHSYFGEQAPALDLVFLGLGDNGHTASLFPHTPVLEEKTRWAAPVYVAEQDLWRITLTAPILNEATLVAFVLGGANKAQVLQEVREGPPDPQRLPAQLIKPTKGQLLWLVDRAAAGKSR